MIWPWRRRRRANGRRVVIIGLDCLEPSVTSHDVWQKAIWDHLSEEGKQCVVISVPPSYPPKPLNGCSISCFLTPNAQTNYTYPPSLKSEIEECFGEYKRAPRGR